MSFMFHPYPYADPSAVNKIEVPESVKKELTSGILNVAKKISALFDGGVKSIGLDAYHHDHHTHHSTSYYVTFQVDSGDRMELHMTGQEYGMLVEGDKGYLTFQGTRYLGFERV